MREIRRDPTTGDEVVISTDRVGRPRHLVPGRTVDAGARACPFCPGHEAHTPSTLAEVRRDGEWIVRAFANKYPAVGIEGALERRARGPYEMTTGVGAHEVIVEARDHDAPIWRSTDQATAALLVARDRMRDLARDGRFKHLVWFRNAGADAGASIAHPHGQIVATPVVPSLVRRMAKRCRQHLERTERELFQDLLDHDLDEQKRIVWEGEGLVALCPWAPRAPFEVWIVPRHRAPSFLDVDEAAVAALAAAMNTILAAQARVLEDPPYNAVLYTAPRDASGFRWHVRILPRLSPLAGFELGTGAIMHGVLPEESARLLRAALG